MSEIGFLDFTLAGTNASLQVGVSQIFLPTEIAAGLYSSADAMEMPMGTLRKPESMDEVSNVVDYLRDRGVQFWFKDERLHYKARKGAMTPADVEFLRMHRGEIVALLSGSAGERTHKPQPQLDEVPLAFSQLAHWHLYGLNERSSLRGIASATRLHGGLQLNILQKSINEIVRRHSALRTRIVVVDGVPVQIISHPGDEWTLEIEDLAELPKNLRESEVMRRIDQHILKPVDLAVDCPFGAKLLRLHDDEHVLILSMDHIVSDVSSMNILLRDLFTAYSQISADAPIFLQPLHFADYARSQQALHRVWIEEHATYWKQHFEGSRLVRLPVGGGLVRESPAGWACVPVQIGIDLTARLHDWCRDQRTTLAMSVFTAYVGLVLRWCETPENVVQFVTNGRTSPALENVIGYLASALYLRVTLRGEDTFINLLNRVTEEYCQAYEHADASYLAAQLPRPDLTFSCVFNWVPQALVPDVRTSCETLILSPIPFQNPSISMCEWDSDPHLVLSDAGDVILGGVYFPTKRFPASTMERLGRDFLTILKTLLERPSDKIFDVPISC
jgi:hypothetical protein